MIKKLIVEFPDDFEFPEFSGSYKTFVGKCGRCPMLAVNDDIEYCFANDEQYARCPFYDGADEVKMVRMQMP